MTSFLLLFPALTQTSFSPLDLIDTTWSNLEMLYRRQENCRNVLKSAETQSVLKQRFSLMLWYRDIVTASLAE